MKVDIGRKINEKKSTFILEWGQLMQERTLFMAAPGLLACIGMNNAHNKSQTTVASNQVHRMYEDVENVGMRPVADCKY